MSFAKLSRNLRFVGLMGGVLLVASSSFAATFFNDRVAVQGFLKYSGTAVDDVVGFPMRFLIKRNSTVVWCQTVSQNVPVARGVFSQTLSGAANCQSLVIPLGGLVFSHLSSSDLFSVDVVVDYQKNGFGGADDATFAGIEMVSTPLAISSHFANVADTANSVTGIVSLANGGTGAATAADARTGLGLGSVSVIEISGVSTDVLRGDGTFGNAPAGNPSLVGDASGTLSAVSVDRIKGRALAATAPTNNQVLTWNSTTSVWEPRVPASAPVSSVAGKVGVVTLASVDVLDATAVNTPSVLVKRDASGDFAAGTITASLVGTSTNVTGVVALANGGTGAATAADARTGLGLGTVAVINTSGVSTEVLRGDGTFGSVPASNPSLAGDASGTLSAVSVDRIKGRNLAVTAPTNNQVLGWNSSLSVWEPKTPTAAPVTTVAGRTGAVVLASADISDAASANTASMIVRRDASGDFSAGSVTATLIGNATNVTGTVAVANGGTGAITAAAARASLGVAASGANTDITSLTGVARTAAVLMAPTSAGSSTAFTIANSPALAALTAGQTVLFRPHAVNGASATLNVDGLGARPLHSAFRGAAVAAGDFLTGKPIEATYDGSNWIVTLPAQYFSGASLNCGTTIAASSFVACPNVTAASVLAGDAVECSPNGDPGAGVTWSVLSNAASLTIRLACSNGATACTLTTRTWKCSVSK